MKKKMKNTILAGTFLTAALLFTACDDVFEPLPENFLPIESAGENSSYADNLLGNAYSSVPESGGYSFDDPATDDAVSNDRDNSWRKIATGSWSSNFNPTSCWDGSRCAIQYCNLFLSIVENVVWAADEEVNKLFHDREIGEAYGLRAIHMYFLLRAHAGKDSEGNLLGIPIVTEPEGEGSNFNLPRNTFRECYDAMLADIAMAMKYLPTEYGSEYFNELRSRYPGVTDGSLERVFGTKFKGRVSGRVLKAFQAKASLLAASPAYAASGVTWEEALEDNGKVLDIIGGINGLDPTGNRWYDDPAIEKYESGQCPPEVIWRSNLANNHALEEDNYPPTLYGKGRINPTQNLVDAFPMANGYPISAGESGYDPANPYADRDPRLGMYILYNGEKMASTQIITAADGTTDDALNKMSNSTRTGYYMRKHLNEAVICNPNNIKDMKHYSARLRYTEFFLNYAEAANEANGPMWKGSRGYSAYDIIKQIRLRAGVGLENGDAYLESIKNDQTKMREMIRNERRLELCFEGFRFYDVRRWNADMNVSAKGVRINGGVGQVFDVEPRSYGSHMIYGPIPNSEVLKFNNLRQNAGW